jgi:hypothetical protein
MIRRSSSPARPTSELHVKTLERLLRRLENIELVEFTGGP